MQRREFLRRVGLIAAGAVAADQLDVLDRLGWKRRFFPSASLNVEHYAVGFRISATMQQDGVYGAGIQRLMEEFQRECGAVRVGRAWDFDSNDIVVKAIFNHLPTHVETQALWKMRKTIVSAMA